MASTSSLWVRTSPRIDDAAEMKTILLFSLRSLWGELEPYSCEVTIKNAPAGHCLSVGKSKALLVVECPTTSVNNVRAALTLVSTPPYLEDTTYQFDVLDIQQNSNN